MHDWNMSRQDKVREAPNYLNANIAMFGVNLTWILFAIWAMAGFVYVLLAGVAINAGLSYLEKRLR
jgi:hypothetical protein